MKSNSAGAWVLTSLAISDDTEHLRVMHLKEWDDVDGEWKAGGP